MTPKAIRALENRDYTTFAQELKQSLSESKMNVLKETVESDVFWSEDVSLGGEPGGWSPAYSCMATAQYKDKPFKIKLKNSMYNWTNKKRYDEVYFRGWLNNDKTKVTISYTPKAKKEYILDTKDVEDTDRNKLDSLFPKSWQVSIFVGPNKGYIKAKDEKQAMEWAEQLRRGETIKGVTSIQEALEELTNNKLLAYQKKASKDILDRKMEKDKKREDKHLDGIDLANKKIARNNSNFTKAAMKEKLQESRPRVPYVSPQWADTRQTDMIVATAIHAVAKGRRTPEEIWDAPTKQEMQAVKNTIVDYIKYGYYDFDPFGFQWGQETIRVKDPEGLFEGFKRGDKVKIVSKGDEYNNKTGEVYRIDAKKEAMTVEFENGRVVSYGFDEVIKEN